ncbi:MAG: Methyltransferase small [Candidatus Daviesbacteria bacterium GW2011_GWA1_41_61]|uniref:Methyltransferase small n=1 Tax=Candidatus Daviesbacteria bacterium GW2011_GWA2_40_9 TaxID=1618424 RepID=A0A0G0U2Y6_9BACT|nr:MAG: Methyltransferase small [Candidatus Daviesbacteria bacterium GW2011_GWC1_40_9]KKR83463.1 MAG: Methyltransferase small [Candidatus Daviesbacteria bacterium GW2011_GWA2_40_9]KKR93845.1 MAG: Methyltransferase small [Candidatus Daviesbacteria bacterium GW2011_GWB1_41_15]KKS15311.1 MAG: Methyltransferase small [Candidatus Daviesbacteria bacterium GW2011_GWA1_41_61]
MDQTLHTENLKGFEIKFHTLPGVFSKQGLDGGTKLLIDYLEIKDETVMADLGAGGGVLGIVLAKLNPHGHVHLLEDHLRAKELAQENVELNGLKNVEVFLSDLFSAVGSRSYHQIFSNPPQHLGNEFLELIALECYKHLKLGGQLWWVMQKHLKPFTQRLLESHFGNCKIVAHGKEHVVLKADKN